MGRGRWLVFIVLVCLCALAVAAATFGPPRAAGAGGGKPAGAGGDEFAGAGEFPWLAPLLPPAREMLAHLAAGRPRYRKGRGGCELLLYREDDDWLRADAIANHYTEKLRVLQQPPGSAVASAWDTWANLLDKPIVFAGAEHSRRAARRRLEELAPVPYDTNPAFAAFILRRLARKLRKETYQVRLIDGNAGWGGQALAAVAADVGCYHGYLPFDNAVRARLAEQLQRALSDNLAPPAVASEFWVRQMALSQVPPRSPADHLSHSAGGRYDVLFLHESDLRPFLPADPDLKIPGVPAFADLVWPGGFVVLFVAPGRRGLSRALLALECMHGWTGPELWGVREGATTAYALIWSKIESAQG